MKFHRVEGKLPGGVAISHDERFGASKSLSDFLVGRTAQYSSNAPSTLRLDVPETAAAEVARVLRAMANELAGSKP